MTEQEKQDIMDKALRDYPAGTVYKDSYNGKKNTSSGKWHFNTDKVIDMLYNSQYGLGKGCNPVWVLSKGWCEIISTPEPVVINNYLIF